MRLERLKAHDVGPFSDVDIDLAALPGPIVAVVGENGQGKSTLLELFAGALYRECPTRGKLQGLATARKSSVEAQVFYGSPYTITQYLDAVSGKAEALVTDGASPLIGDTKVRSYDAWAARALPSPEVFYSSLFSAQKSQGMLELKPAERKAVLLRALGIERYEALAASARERAASAKVSLQTAVARLQDERARGGSVPDAEAALGVARERVVGAGINLDAVTAELEALKRQAAVAESANAEVARIAARRRELEAETSKLDRELGDLSTRHLEAEALLARRQEIEAVEVQRAAAEAQVSASRVAVTALQGEVRFLAEAKSRAATELQRARQDLDRVRSDIEETGRWLDIEAGAIEDASALREAAEADAGAARARVATLEGELAEQQAARISAATGRIGALREGLDGIAAETAGDPAAAARATLDRDSQIEEAGRLAPSRIREIEAALGAARADAERFDRMARQYGEHAARLPEVTSRRQLAKELEAQIPQLLTETEAAEALVALADEQLDAKSRELDTAAEAEEEIATAAMRLPASRIAELERAQARIEEIQPQLVDVTARLRQAKDALLELPQLEPVASVDLAGKQAAHAAAEGVLRWAEAERTRAETVLERARESATRQAALEAERASIEEDLSDWTLLAQSLGRDGLQAAEIDSAVPELEALINDLLSTCVGRWTVRIDTVRQSDSARKQVECLEFMILDSEPTGPASDWRPASTLSGGEAVLVGEAIALGLTMLSAARLGVDRPTLVRDESGAALDPTKTRAYVAMLRRAVEIVRADKLLIVSHNPEVWELCDSQLVVHQGKVVVQ